MGGRGRHFFFGFPNKMFNNNNKKKNRWTAGLRFVQLVARISFSFSFFFIFDYADARNRPLRGPMKNPVTLLLSQQTTTMRRKIKGDGQKKKKKPKKKNQEKVSVTITRDYAAEFCKWKNKTKEKRNESIALLIKSGNGISADQRLEVSMKLGNFYQMVRLISVCKGLL